MNNTVIDFIIIASVLIGYFISLSLVTTSFYKSRANNYLSLSLFLITSLILIEWYGPQNKFLSFIFFSMLELLISVTLLTYFLTQIEHKHLKKKWYKWLYAPFICSVIIEVILHLDSIFHLYHSNFAIIVLYIKDNFSLGFNLFLIFWGRRLILRANTVSKSKKRWLLRLNLFLILIILSWLFAKIEPIVFRSQHALYLPQMILTFLSWWILYYGIFRLQIVVQKDEIHQYLVSKKTGDNRIKKPVKPDTASKTIVQLYALMDEEELYKNPLLSRLDIAARLEISEVYLSQIINQEINKSVVQFVNEYRIRTAQKLLHDPTFNKYSVEAIGMEAGFKSKSAFYSAFKMSIEMSPGAFRKLQ